MFIPIQERLNVDISDTSQEEEKENVRIPHEIKTTSCKDDRCSHVQVIICSCSSHSLPGTIHINLSESNSNSLNSVTLQSLPIPTIRDLLTAFTPSPLLSFAHTYATPHLRNLVSQSRTALIPQPVFSFAQQHVPSLLNLASLPLSSSDALSHLRDLDIRSRAVKYIRNPFRLLGLANRSRIGAQNLGAMSFRLFFNIAVVVIWLLLRRFAEIFGIKLRPLALAIESSESYASEPDCDSTTAVAHEGEGWNEVQRRGKERERARKRREDWVEIEG